MCENKRCLFVYPNDLSFGQTQGIHRPELRAHRWCCILNGSRKVVGVKDLPLLTILPRHQNQSSETKQYILCHIHCFCLRFQLGSLLEFFMSTF